MSNMGQVVNFMLILKSSKFRAFFSGLSGSCMFSYFSSEVKCANMLICSPLKGAGALQALLYRVQYKCVSMSPLLYMRLRSCMCVGVQAAYSYVCMFSFLIFFFFSSLTLCKVLQTYSRYRVILGKVADLYLQNLCCMWEACDPS